MKWRYLTTIAAGGFVFAATIAMMGGAQSLSVADPPGDCAARLGLPDAAQRQPPRP